MFGKIVDNYILTRLNNRSFKACHCIYMDRVDDRVDEFGKDNCLEKVGQGEHIGYNIENNCTVKTGA